MSSTGLEVFDETLHKTNMWLKEIAQELSVDRHGAYQVLRAVLHNLRDRLTINEAADLGDQLPMLIRGIYCEAWHPAGSARKLDPYRETDALAKNCLLSMYRAIERLSSLEHFPSGEPQKEDRSDRKSVV